MNKKNSKKAISRQEVLIKVQSQPVQYLKESDLGPEKDGGKYMIPKTWMSEKQVLKVIQRTPAQHIYKRKGRGGQTFDYVTGTYVTKVLNFVFGWNWDFEVISHGKEGEQVWVQGKLTVKSPSGDTITKSQFGRADVKFLKGTKNPVDYGNDLKAATTDALKKCASMLGIASDVYGKVEYKQEADLDVQTPAQVVSPDRTGESMPSGTPFRLLDVTKQGSDPFKNATVCKDCDSIITKQEADFSQKIFKKNLCRNCQNLNKK